MKRDVAWRLGAAVVMCVAVAGCSTEGRLLTADGPRVREFDTKDVQAGSQIAQFAQIYQAAAAASVPSTTTTPPSAAAVNALNLALLDKGAAILNNTCVDYFRSQGRIKNRFNLVKDLTTGLFGLATGILTAGGIGGDAPAILSLSQTGFSSAINIADHNFLFASDNIDKVRSMTLNSMAGHLARLRELQAQSPSAANFNWVTQQLMDHQELCEDTTILATAKEAIAEANLTAHNSATPGKTEKTENTATTSGRSATSLAARSGAGAAASASQPTVNALPSRVIMRVRP